MAKGANIERRKKNNRNRILNIIRNNSNMSRFELKKVSKYSMSTVLSVVEELLEKRFIVESGMGESRIGRKPTWLEINPNAGYFIGIEFNAEFMYSVALDFLGDIIYSDKATIVSGPDNKASIMELMKRKIEEIIDNLGKPLEKIFGIGIGAPGYVDDKRGISIYYPHIKNWNNVAIKTEIENAFKIETFVESNVNAMALAYKWLRPDVYREDFLLISIRTGIKMSLMMNGQIYKGKNNTAGEIGHVRVQSSNRVCSCGMKGCLETEVSNEGIRIKLLEGIEKNRFKDLLNMVENSLDRVNVYSFIESVKRGHEDSLRLFEEICEYLGDEIANLVNTLNPSRVILSGEITKLGEMMLDTIKKYIRNKVIFVNINDLRVELSSFDDNIGALGSAAIVMQQEFEFYSKPL